MKRILHFKLKLIMALVVLVALAKSLAFALALWAENNKDWVEQQISMLLGTQVHMAHISTSWLSLAPSLSLKDLRLGNGQEGELRLGEVEVGIRLRALGDWRQTLPLSILLKGMRIHVLRNTDGSTRIAGLNGGSGGGGGGKHTLPAFIHVQDGELIWEDRLAANAPIRIEHLDIRVVSSPELNRLSLVNGDGSLYFRIDNQGDLTSDDWSARIYIQAENLAAAHVLNPYLGEHQLSHLLLNLEGWSDWRQGRQVSRQLEITSAEAALADNSLPPFTLKASLLQRYQGNSWQAQLTGLEVSGQGFQLKPGLMQLSRSLEGGSLSLYAQSLAIAPLAKPLAFRPGLTETLAALSPQGELHDLQVIWPTDRPWQASVDLAGYHQNRWQDVPGLANISGRVQATPEQLVLDLNSEDASIDLRPLFRDPIELAELSGRIELARLPDNGWRVKSTGVKAANADIETLTALRVEASSKQPLYLDLYSTFHGEGGNHASKYYPVAIMDNNLVDWLDRSIIQGKVPSGSFTLKGHARDFPFDKTNNGIFEVLFRGEQVRLDYFPGWPAITEAAATVRFFGNSLHIDADGGRLLGNDLKGTVDIESLNPISPLKIAGQTEGELKQQLQVLTETPLKERFAGRLKPLRLSGTGLTRINLAIPLQEDQPWTFNGKTEFKGSRLAIPDYQILLERMRGQLSMNDNGVSIKGMKAKSLGADVLIDMQIGDSGSTSVQAAGSFDIAALSAQYPWLASLPATGRAMTHISVDLPAESSAEPVRLKLNSELVGIKIDLPAPLGKSAEDQRTFELKMPISSEHPALDLNYARGLELSVRPTPDKRLRVQAAMPELPLGDWLDTWEQISLPQTGDSPQVGEFRMKLGSLEHGLLQTEALQLDARNELAGWAGNLSSDKVSGSFLLPHESSAQPLRVRLEKLALTSADRQTSEENKRHESSATAESSPEFDIICQNLSLDGQSLGNLELHSSKQGAEQVIDKLSLNGGALRLDAQGGWQTGAEGQRSRIQGKLEMDDIATLTQLAGNKARISAKNTSIGFNLNWPGQPWTFSMPKLSGKIDISTGQGSLAEVKPGIARLLGLFNVQALGRRLRFDFSDVTQQGFGFDRIEGKLSLESGMMFSNNLNISAPSSDVGIAGNLNLELKLMDLLISISPRLDTALPVAGAVVGGPATGVAVLLAQQLVDSTLSAGPSLRYSAKGSWENPDIEKMSGGQEEESVDVLSNSR